MWFVGIDWADAHHDVAVVDAQGTRQGALRVAHSAAGLEELATWLRTQAVRAASAASAAPSAAAEAPSAAAAIAPDPEQLACVVETTHGLLITALLAGGFPVYPVNPKTLAYWRSPSGAKSDAADAYLLARKGRSDLGELRRLVPESPLVQELTALTRDQNGLVHQQTRLVNQVTACLKAYYPVALELFSRLTQRTTLAFLQRYPTLEAARAASVEELQCFLRTLPHVTNTAVTAQHIVARVHAPQVAVDAVTVRTKARLLLALVGQLALVFEQIAAYDAEIARLFAQHPDAAIYASLPGTGKRLAPRLLVGWGDDRTRYRSAASVQGLAGTAPVTVQSGKYTTVRRRRACKTPLGDALQQFAWHSTTQEEWAQRYYQRKRSEGKSHQGAVRALANQWVRIIHALWRTHTCYDRAIFQAAQAAHGRTAA